MAGPLVVALLERGKAKELAIGIGKRLAGRRERREPQFELLGVIAIDERRGEANLTASIRVFIVSYYRTAIGNRGFAEDGQSPLLNRAMDDAVPLD